MDDNYRSKFTRPPSSTAAKAGIGPGAGGGSVFSNAPPRGTGVHSAFNSGGPSFASPPAAKPRGSIFGGVRPNDLAGVNANRANPNPNRANPMGQSRRSSFMRGFFS